ncbi:ecto-NOX disulfide-thiol exchanger 1 isoform X4 [Salmo salar]|uniref:Ecto-NOX disulfide-thiol exchanger 1 isoform X4 n=1 Tax=Salmo salar TaxID=8030 RepID=A0A1S3RRV9_SALSA|nr:ecto-NOX disulfide-thiol exchanger 1 isoform X4 [Salmo salar]|eukprot:XP_014054577.1 PREDICTED: ecto-NOX disulfide-thiol exchanger 1-like isoform X5 [Salmo salar]
MYKDYRSGRAAGLNPLSFDPSSNNEPLQFSNSNVPLVSDCPLENGAEKSIKRKRPSLPPEGIRNMSMDSNPMPMPMSDPNAWATAMNNLGMAPMNMTGQPLLSDFDSGLGMMTGMNPMMPGLGYVPPPPLPHDLPIIKEIIHYQSCTLFPPNPSYRMRLGSSTDKKDTGRLHVDFAQARDDLYEWECRQRLYAREERHRRRMEEDRFRPPSPPPIVHYSDHECCQLGDKIKDEAAFAEAVHVLLTWVERGEVNRRNANNFYSMIQSSNSHIRQLMSQKATHEKELEVAKDKFKTALSGILAQFEQIVSVFHAASKQKAWDHFSKAQRKNLDMWRKQAEEIRNMQNEELMGIRREEEMEMSDDDMEDTHDPDDSGPVAQVEALKEENDSLRCQLDAYRNEVELLKQEQGKNQEHTPPQHSEEDTIRQQQLTFLQQALQGMQKQLLKMCEEMKQREAELEKSVEDKQQLEIQVQSLKEGLESLKKTRTPQLETSPRDDRGSEESADQVNLETSPRDDRGSEESADQVNEATALEVVSCSQEKESLPPEKIPSSPVYSEREALLVGIISTFLHVHPFGASIEYIFSYLQQLDTKINTGQVGALLGRLPCTFRQELTGVGASLEKRWKFCGFEGIKSK